MTALSYKPKVTRHDVTVNYENVDIVTISAISSMFCQIPVLLFTSEWCALLLQSDTILYRQERASIAPSAALYKYTHLLLFSSEFQHSI